MELRTRAADTNCSTENLLPTFIATTQSIASRAKTTGGTPSDIFQLYTVEWVPGCIAWMGALCINPGRAR